ASRNWYSASTSVFFHAASCCLRPYLLALPIARASRLPRTLRPSWYCTRCWKLRWAMSLYTLAQRISSPARTTYTAASLPLLSGRMTASITPSSISACRPAGVFMAPRSGKAGSMRAWKTRIGASSGTPECANDTLRPLFPWCRGMSDPVRLARRVAELARCSRAEAEQYVQGGWVKVDGRVVEEPQLMVTGEAIEIDHAARLQANEPATILLHKPAGLDACEGASP